MVNVVFCLNCVYEPRDLFDDDDGDDVNVLIQMIYDELSTISRHPSYLVEDPAYDVKVQYYLIEVVLNWMSMLKVAVDLVESVVIHLNDVDNRIENEEFPLIYPEEDSVLVSMSTLNHC